MNDQEKNPVSEAEKQGQTQQEAGKQLNPEIAALLYNQGDQLKKLMEVKKTKEVDPRILTGVAAYLDAIAHNESIPSLIKMKVSENLSKKLGLGLDTTIEIKNQTPISNKPNDKFAYMRVNIKSVLTKSDNREFTRTQAYDPTQDDAVWIWRQQNIDITIDHDGNGKPYVTEFSKGFTTDTHVKNYVPEELGRRPKEDENIHGPSFTNRGKGPQIDEEKLLLLLNETIQKMASPEQQ